jgi:hypothetical protein
VTRKVIVYRRPDGGVTEHYPSPGSRLVLAVEDAPGADAEALAALRALLPAPLGRVRRALAELGLDGASVTLETVQDWLTRAAAKERAGLLEPRARGEEQAEYESRLACADVPRVVVDADDLPPGRWRNAWDLVDGAVTVNLAKARAMRAAELGPRRKAAMERLTALIQAAEDEGRAARAAQLRAKRRALRDLDLAAAAAGAADLEALEALAPAEITEAESLNGE